MNTRQWIEENINIYTIARGYTCPICKRTDSNLIYRVRDDHDKTMCEDCFFFLISGHIASQPHKERG